MFGQHGNGSIHQIDRCGTLLRLRVNDRTFEHIMTYISNVYTHFPKTILDFLDGNSIVKVLRISWVNRDSERIAEILTLGNFLFRNASLYLVGSSLNILDRKSVV